VCVESFERFYSAEHGSVSALLFAMTGDWQLAEDLAQEAFTRALQRWSRIRRHENPQAWIRTVAANLARSRFRRQAVERRRREKLSASSSYEEPAPLPYELARFWEAVRALPRQQSLAITLHYLEDRQPAEMTDILGCSPATARVHLHRARQRLQQQLDLAECKDLA
jgi:RNA polymerase sigma-70 factor, ECF subfamily